MPTTPLGAENAPVQVVSPEASPPARRKRAANLAENLPRVRQGAEAHRAMTRTATQVRSARRKALMSRAATPEQVEALRDFNPTPLSWPERLVMRALVALAAAEDRAVRDHQCSTRATLESLSVWVEMEVPAHSRIARVLGYESEADGTMPVAVRRLVKRAIHSLLKETRLIPISVVVSHDAKGRPVYRPVVQTDPWLKIRHDPATGETRYALHPASIADHYRSFIEFPQIGRAYEKAREAIGATRITDAMAAADDYCRTLRMAIPRAWAKKSVSLQSAMENLCLDEGLLAKHGRARVLERITEAFRFAQEVGSLVTWSYSAETEMYELTLPQPGQQERLEGESSPGAAVGGAGDLQATDDAAEVCQENQLDLLSQVA